MVAKNPAKRGQGCPRKNADVIKNLKVVEEPAPTTKGRRTRAVPKCFKDGADIEGMDIDGEAGDVPAAVQDEAVAKPTLPDSPRSAPADE